MPGRVVAEVDLPPTPVDGEPAHQARLRVGRLAVALLQLAVHAAHRGRDGEPVSVDLDGRALAFLGVLLRLAEQGEGPQDRLVLVRLDRRQDRFDLHRHVGLRVDRVEEALRLGEGGVHLDAADVVLLEGVRIIQDELLRLDDALRVLLGDALHVLDDHVGLRLVDQLYQHLLLLGLQPRVIDLAHGVGQQAAVLDVAAEQLRVAPQQRDGVVHPVQHLEHQRSVELRARLGQRHLRLVDRAGAATALRRLLLRLGQLRLHLGKLLAQVAQLLRRGFVARLPVRPELRAGPRHARVRLERLDVRLQLVALAHDVVVGAADLRELRLQRRRALRRVRRLLGTRVAVGLEHRRLLLEAVPVARPAQHLGELPLHLHARVDRVGDLRFHLLDLLAQVLLLALHRVELAAEHAGRVLRLGHLALERSDAVLHGPGGALLLLDRRGRLVGPADLGDDEARLGQLLHQLAALLAELRQLRVLLLELVVQLLLLARGGVRGVLRHLHLLLQLLRLRVARLDLRLDLVLALGEHLDQVVLLLELPRDGVALGAADGDAVLPLLDLPLQRLHLAAAVRVDGLLHPLALALQLGWRVVRLLLVQVLLQLLQLLVLLLEQPAQLLRVGPGAGGRVVRHLLLHLDDLRLQLAVLLLEERDLPAQGGDLHLVLRLHLGAQGGLRRAARLVGDDARLGGRLLGRRGARPRSRGAATGSRRRSRARLRLVGDELRLGHPEGDGVAVLELLAVDVAVVDEGAVGGPQVHDEEHPVLAPDLRVLGGHAGVADLDVAARPAAHRLGVGDELDLLAFQGPVQHAQRGHEPSFVTPGRRRCCGARPRAERSGGATWGQTGSRSAWTDVLKSDKLILSRSAGASAAAGATRWVRGEPRRASAGPGLQGQRRREEARAGQGSAADQNRGGRRPLRAVRAGVHRSQARPDQRAGLQGGRADQGRARLRRQAGQGVRGRGGGARAAVPPRPAAVLARGLPGVNPQAGAEDFGPRVDGGGQQGDRQQDRAGARADGRGALRLQGARAPGRRLRLHLAAEGRGGQRQPPAHRREEADHRATSQGRADHRCAGRRPEEDARPHQGRRPGRRGDHPRLGSEGQAGDRRQGEGRGRDRRGQQEARRERHAGFRGRRAHAGRRRHRRGDGQGAHAQARRGLRHRPGGDDRQRRRAARRGGQLRQDGREARREIPRREGPARFRQARVLDEVQCGEARQEEAARGAARPAGPETGAQISGGGTLLDRARGRRRPGQADPQSALRDDRA